MMDALKIFVLTTLFWVCLSSGGHQLNYYLGSATADDETPSPTPSPTPSFTKLGEGECRQADGEYALQYSVGYYDLRPWAHGSNAAQATAKCEYACAQYAWCFAAEVVLREDSDTPSCSLITDRPTFEQYNGSGQDYSWGADKDIDGVSYQTYCGGSNHGTWEECGPGNTYASNWNGGKLGPRMGYWCYINNNIAGSVGHDGGEDQTDLTAAEGWTLKDGCTEKRCSSKQRTATQEDAAACCDFFALPQKVKTQAIVADKAGWATVEAKTWAEKLAWVLAAGDSSDDTPDDRKAAKKAAKREAKKAAKKVAKKADRKAAKKAKKGAAEN